MMKTTFLTIAVAALTVCGSVIAADLEQALKQFAGYEYGGSKKVLHDTRMTAFRGTDDAALRLKHEQLLLDFLKSGAPLDARREACFWLRALATDASIPTLKELAAQDDFCDVAQIALDALKGQQQPSGGAAAGAPGRFRAAVMKSEKQIEILADALLGDDEKEARLALNLIGEGVATKEACAWLGTNAGKLSADRQVVAMNLLLQLDAPQKEIVIGQLAREGSGVARLAAIRNLGALGRETDVAGLMSLVLSSDRSVAEAAWFGLLSMPEEALRAGLLEALKGSDPGAQGKAVELAGARGAGFAAEELFRIAGEENNPNRKAAAAALGTAAPPKTFERALAGFAKADGTPIEREMQSSVWMLARRQADYDQAAKIMGAWGAKSSEKVRAALESMAGKLGALKQKTSLTQATKPAPSGKPSKAKALLPGKFDVNTPKRFEVAAYLDCGSQNKVEQGGITIECLNGKSWNSDPGTDPSLSVCFAPSSLDFAISGLEAGTDYILGMTWWDAGLDGRRQSVAINGREVLPDTRAIAYDENKATPTRIRFALLPGHIGDGPMKLSIRKVAGPNAVNSELWIMRRKQAAAGKQVLLVSGQDFPGHHWRKTGPVVADIIEADPRMEVTICETPYALGLAHLDAYDVVFMHFKNYEGPLPSTKAMHENLDRYVRAGGGMCLSHFACGAMEEWPQFVELSGRVWNGEGHDKRGPFTVRVVDRNHPITRGLDDFQTDDELYFCLKGSPEIHLLCDAHSKVKKADHPQAFVIQPGRGRVFLCTLGHDVKAYDAGEVRQLYRRATAWAAGLE